MLGLGLRPASVALSVSQRIASAGLAMTQLTAGRVYQRSTKTGGGASKGAGSIVVPITLQAAASKIEYRLRDALASGNPTLQDWTTAAASVAATATSVTCPGVPADAKQYLLDLRANNDNAQIVLGTSAVMMGRIIAAAGQSQMVRQFSKTSTDTATLASLGVTVSPYCGVYATYSDSSVPGGGTASWAAPADNGIYTSAYAAEFLRRQVALSGVACGWVGNSVGGTAIAAWAPGSTNNVNLRAILDAAGGFEAFYWHQGGDDAGAGTSKATYKSALDAMFNDIAQHNAIWGTNFAKLLTAMATRTSSGAGTTATVQAIRQAQKEWAATNSSIYLEPHDVTLEDGAVHQNQTGNVTLAQHAHRALATNDVGPTFGTPTLSTDNASLYIPINLPTGATGLVLTGNAKSRLSVFPAGTQANPLTISTLAYDSTNKRLVAALSAAATTNVDVYAFLHPDPSGTTANADMIRDDRTDGDGITVGRSLEPTTAGPLTASLNATAPGAGPAVGDVVLMNFYNSDNSSPSAASGWNNYNAKTGSSTSKLPLKNTAGNDSGLTLYVINGNMTAGNNAGAVPSPSGSGDFPDDVILSSVFADNTGSNGTGTSTLIDAKIEGFAAGTQWKVEMLGSRAVASRVQNMAVNGGTAVSADVGQNKKISATFTGIVPSSGAIDAQVTQGSGQQFCYLNGLRLTRTA